MSVDMPARSSAPKAVIATLAATLLAVLASVALVHHHNNETPAAATTDLSVRLVACYNPKEDASKWTTGPGGNQLKCPAKFLVPGHRACSTAPWWWISKYCAKSTWDYQCNKMERSGYCNLPTRKHGFFHQNWAHACESQGSHCWHGVAAHSAIMAQSQPIDDWGKACSQDTDCASKMCGTSCSHKDIDKYWSTSCTCPCEDNEKCCCGCITNGQTEITTCPADFFRQRAHSYTESVYDSDREVKVLYTGPSKSGKRTFGMSCNKAQDCKSGMCGTGCDCPSSVKELCSCESLCNYPHKCCGGCFIGTNTNMQTCPYHPEGQSFQTTSGEMLPWNITTGVTFTTIQ